LNRFTRVITFGLVFAFAGTLPAQDPPKTGRDLLAANEAAVKLYGKGKFEDAIRILTQALGEEKGRGGELPDVMVTNLVRSYLSSARRALRNRRPDQALRILREAASWDDRNAEIAAFRGMVLMEKGFLAAAAEALEQALRWDRNCAAAHQYLGLLQYRQEALEPALANLTKAAELDPARREALGNVIAKIRRELAIEGAMRTRSSTHFLCKYSGEQSTKAADQVLDWLEEAYREMGLGLHEFPSDLLTVILYSDRDFKRVTGVHSWVAGVFDGKIRVPMRNFEARKREIRQTLRHEFTHFLVSEITTHCPAWFNEGLAQIGEGRSLEAARIFLRRSKEAKRWVPLRRLPPSFAVISDSRTAQLAYTESFGFVAYLKDRYGIGRIEELLRALGGKKKDFYEVFYDVFRRRFDEVVLRWEDSL